MTTKKNTPAEATVTRIAGLLSRRPQWTSDIAVAAGLSVETVRRCLVHLAANGQATKLDDGRWVAAEPEHDNAWKEAHAVPTGAPATPFASRIERKNAASEAAKNGSSAEDVEAILATPVAQAPTAVPSTRKPKSERMAEVLAVRKAKGGKRGPGRKVTDEELVAHIAEMRRQHPDSSCYIECEYAYWVLGWAVTRHRFNPVWDAYPATDAELADFLRKSPAEREGTARAEATVTDIAKAQGASERVRARRASKQTSA